MSSARRLWLFGRKPCRKPSPDVVVCERVGDVPPEVYVSLPPEFLAPLIVAQMRAGNFEKMAKDAIRIALRNGRPEDADLYRNMLNQVSDFYAGIK